MAANTIYKGKMSPKTDIFLWDGRTSTDTRSNSTGGTDTLTKFQWTGVDVLNAYGLGANYTLASIQDAVNAIGTTNKVNLWLAPGTWTITDDLNIPNNIGVTCADGCDLAVSTGKTITFDGPFFASTNKVFSLTGTGAIRFGSSMSDSRGPMYIIPQWFGALADNSTNDAAAIQAAIASLTNTGGIVFFIPGIYYIDTALTMVAGVTLRGSGWDEPLAEADTDPANLDKGTWFSIDSTSIIPFSILTTSGVTLENFGVYHDHAAPGGGWSPTAYDWTIQITTADKTVLKDLCLLNPNKGINQDDSGGAGGRLYIDNIIGQPLNEGIKIENSTGAYSVRIKGVRWDRFWSADSNVYLTHMAANAIGIELQYTAGIHLEDYSCRDYLRGLYLSQSGSGGTSLLAVSNWTAIECKFPLSDHADSNLNSASFVNCHLHSASLANSINVDIDGDNCRYAFTNVTLDDPGAECIDIGGSTNVVQLSNVLMKSWGTTETTGASLTNQILGHICRTDADESWFA